MQTIQIENETDLGTWNSIVQVPETPMEIAMLRAVLRSELAAEWKGMKLMAVQYDADGWFNIEYRGKDDGINLFDAPVETGRARVMEREYPASEAYRMIIESTL